MDIHKRKLVVVVDSEPDDGEILTQLFEAAGHRACRVADASQLESVLLHAIPKGIVIDLDSVASEWEVVTSKVRSAAPDQPVKLVAISGWDLDRYGNALKRAGIDAYLQKPTPFRAICDALGISTNGMILL